MKNPNVTIWNCTKAALIFVPANIVTIALEASVAFALVTLGLLPLLVLETAIIVVAATKFFFARKPILMDELKKRFGFGEIYADWMINANFFSIILSMAAGLVVGYEASQGGFIYSIIFVAIAIAFCLLIGLVQLFRVLKLARDKGWT